MIRNDLVQQSKILQRNQQRYIFLILKLFKSNANTFAVCFVSLLISGDCWVLDLLILMSEHHLPTKPDQPALSSLLTFFTQGWLPSPSFFFFSIATCGCGVCTCVCVCDSRPCVHRWGPRPSRSDHFIGYTSSPLCLCLASAFSCNPAQTGPTMRRDKHNAMNCFPRPFFFSLSLPSTSPSLSYLCILV